MKAIQRRNGKWCVIDVSGANKGKVLGTHPTREQALAQLRAIEGSKHGGPQWTDYIKGG